MLGIGAIPGFIMLVGMFLLPESPRWLLMKGKKPTSFLYDLILFVCQIVNYYYN